LGIITIFDKRALLFPVHMICCSIKFEKGVQHVMMMP